MNEELLQSYVRANVADEEEPSRLYPPQPKKDDKKEKKKKEKIEDDRSSDRRSSIIPSWSRRKPTIVIEQRKVNMIAQAIDECYCDKDRAAAVSFGYMDIKQELKAKQGSDKMCIRIMPDDTDAMAFLMLGMRAIKNNNLDNGVKFLSKVRWFGNGKIIKDPEKKVLRAFREIESFFATKFKSFFVFAIKFKNFFNFLL